MSIKDVTDNIDAGIQLRTKAAAFFDKNEITKGNESLKGASDKFQAACEGVSRKNHMTLDICRHV